jgi:GDP-L-fucose synthase
MHRQSVIYVAGGDSLLGAALIRMLQESGFEDLVGVPPFEPDLTLADHVEDFFQSARPEYVFVAGGPTGGIEENRRHPADLMIDNLLVATNVVPAAFRNGVRKLLYVASSCCYPMHAPQPFSVSSLLSGPLEASSEAYALAKVTGLKLCQAYRQQYEAPFITAVLANLFGPGDDFHPESGHVIPALMGRLHKAKERGDRSVVLWGTGSPRRDFLFGPDAAAACLHLMQHYDAPTPINIGSGWDRSIAEVANLIAEVVGYSGRLHFDHSHPDGMPRKLLDSAPLAALGWQSNTPFRAALEATYAWFLENQAKEDDHARAVA